MKSQQMAHGSLRRISGNDMTHDELLLEIDLRQLYYKALRAVVEYIHRDRTIAIGIPLTDYERGLRDADRQIIAIIEKELK